MIREHTTPADRRAWSYKAGEKGRNRVRVFAWQGGIWIDYREDGKRVRHRLAYTDRDRAKREADKIAARFTELPIEGARGTAAPMTLRSLFDIYQREVTPQKAKSTQAHDRCALRLFLRAFGATRQPDTLNRRDWDSYVERRRRGEIAPPGRKGQRVRSRIIEQDLKLLLAVLNWAERSRDDAQGGYLVARNPLRGLKVPREESPRRPQITREQLETLLLVAAELSPRAVLFVALAWYTGHRAGSIRQLRWSDVNLEAERLRWRGETDKVRTEHETPMHPALVPLLVQEQERTGGAGEGFVFPSEHDAERPMSREDATELWGVLRRRAGIPDGRRYGWHAFRRAFANQLRNVPLKELQTLGGWKSEATVVRVYLQPDVEAQRAALERLPVPGSGNGQ